MNESMTSSFETKAQTGREPKTRHGLSNGSTLLARGRESTGTGLAPALPKSVRTRAPILGGTARERILRLAGGPSRRRGGPAVAPATGNDRLEGEGPGRRRAGPSHPALPQPIGR